MVNTEINWADDTFNLWIGCMKYGPECVNCYAEILIDSRYGANSDTPAWGKNGVRRLTSENNRKNPYRFNRKAEKEGRQRFVFCGSLMDVMEIHPTIPPEWREELFQTIRVTPWLTWLLLTKRPENYNLLLPKTPFPNVWLGTTCGDNGVKEFARVKALRETPIASGCHRFISAEPLLADISGVDLAGISWVIAGGESGTGPKIRPFKLEHALALYEKCKREKIDFWFKQMGQKTVAGGELLDLVSSLHDTIQLPPKFRKMDVRSRPAHPLLQLAQKKVA